MHNSIILTVGKNQPQMIEGALAAATQPGTCVQKNADGKLEACAVNYTGLVAILMPNTLFGGDVRDKLPVGEYGVAVLAQGDCDYAVRVVGTVAKPLPEGTLLKFNANGELVESTDGVNARFSLREAHTFVAGALTVRLAVRKL